MEKKMTIGIRVNSKTYTASRKRDAEIASYIVGICHALMNTKYDKVRRENGLVNYPNFVAVPSFNFAEGLLSEIARYCEIPFNYIMDICQVCAVDLNA